MAIAGMAFLAELQVGLCMIMDITKPSLIQLMQPILIPPLNMILSGGESDYWIMSSSLSRRTSKIAFGNSLPIHPSR